MIKHLPASRKNRVTGLTDKKTNTFKSTFKVENFIVLFFILLSSTIAKAQTPMLLGSYIYSSKGTTVTPSFNWTIPAGKNRVMVVSTYIERNHLPAPYGDNYPVSNADPIAQPILTVDEITMNYPPDASGDFRIYYQFLGSSTSNAAGAYISSTAVYHYLTDAGGLPTGLSTFSFSNLKTPTSASDEIIVSISVFENAKQAYPKPFWNSDRETNLTSFSTLTATSPTIPVGTANTNIVYLADAMVSQEGALSNNNSALWVNANSTIVNNSSGSFTTIGSISLPTENDGISLRSVYGNNFASTPSITFSRAGSGTILSYIGRLLTILPLARPSVSGTVYSDTDGPTNINGTAIGGGGLYVNAYDDAGNFVVSASVATTGAGIGTFTIPTGNLIETYTYTLKLSKNQATTANPNPTQELNANWATVGESLSASGNDGLADGNLLVTMATVNITGIRYGIKACLAGSSAPLLNPATNYSVVNSAYNISCGSTTANLSGITASNKPALATITLTWHTATPATDLNKISNFTALTGTTKYYAAFFDSANGCYSPTKEIMVYAPICATDDDYTATPLILGTGGTFPSIFGNDTYKGITLSTLAPNSVQWLPELWTAGLVAVDLTNAATYGVLTIPSANAEGIYESLYSINDNSPGAVPGSSKSVATVRFRVVADTDKDGIPDYSDLDDDNDGILDIVEDCKPYLAQNTTGAWKGKTTSDITVVTTAGTVANAVASTFNDFQSTYNVNANGAAQRLAKAGNINYKITFSTPVKASEIAFLIDGVNDAAGLSYSLRFNDGNGGNQAQGYFIAMPMSTGGVSLNYNLGAKVATSSGTGVNNQKLLLKGITDNLVYSVELTSTNVAAANMVYYSFFSKDLCDTDGDKVANQFDLDSDGDNCFDAIEGDENVLASQLKANGSINSTTNGGVGNTPNVNYGVPNLVNSGGTADVGSDIGQGLGTSQDANANPCCTNQPATGTPDGFTKTGVSDMAGFANGWPGNVPNGFIAIESKNKGFVITRVQNSGKISVPKEGMLIYDIDGTCIKLYYDNAWHCLQKSCN